MCLKAVLVCLYYKKRIFFFLYKYHLVVLHCQDSCEKVSSIIFLFVHLLYSVNTMSGIFSPVGDVHPEYRSTFTSRVNYAWKSS